MLLVSCRLRLEKHTPKLNTVPVGVASAFRPSTWEVEAEAGRALCSALSSLYNKFQVSHSCKGDPVQSKQTPKKEKLNCGYLCNWREICLCLLTFNYLFFQTALQ